MFALHCFEEGGQLSLHLHVADTQQHGFARKTGDGGGRHRDGLAEPLPAEIERHHPARRDHQRVVHAQPPAAAHHVHEALAPRRPDEEVVGPRVLQPQPPSPATGELPERAELWRVLGVDRESHGRCPN